MVAKYTVCIAFWCKNQWMHHHHHHHQETRCLNKNKNIIIMKNKSWIEKTTNYYLSWHHQQKQHRIHLRNELKRYKRKRVSWQWQVCLFVLPNSSCLSLILLFSGGSQWKEMQNAFNSYLINEYKDCYCYRLLPHYAWGMDNNSKITHCTIYSDELLFIQSRSKTRTRQWKETWKRRVAKTGKHFGL